MIAAVVRWSRHTVSPPGRLVMGVPAPAFEGGSIVGYRAGLVAEGNLMGFEGCVLVGSWREMSASECLMQW